MAGCACAKPRLALLLKKFVSRFDSSLESSLVSSVPKDWPPNGFHPTEVEIAQLESGKLMMMGRQILALKQFKGDEVNDIAQEPAAASLPTNSSETPVTPQTASFGPNNPPVVTNVLTEKTPPRKKSKTEVDS